MATLVMQQQTPLPHASTPDSLPTALTLNTSRAPTPVPNKHLPYCPPGPTPSSSQLVTPPSSPPTKSSNLAASGYVLHPPTSHSKLSHSPPYYGIDAETLAAALEQLASLPLLDPGHVFPWLHGLHPENQMQLAFFVQRKKSLRKVPKHLRSITIVKAGGDLSKARIKGAVAPDEVLSLCDDSGKGFHEDPREGFNVRNFHIQTAKLAQVSDIVIYGDDNTDYRIIKSVAERTSAVQRKWKKDLELTGQSPESYNTFVLTSPFDVVEEKFPELVAIDSQGKTTGQVLDFSQTERIEMSTMTKASEINHGVFLGPTPGLIPVSSDDEQCTFDVFVEASDQATLPDDAVLQAKASQLGDDPVHIAFPSSGCILPPAWSQAEADGILSMCKWIYGITHLKEPVEQVQDKDGDIQMTEFSPRPRKVLLHCADGYTETSMLAVAYTMYAEGIPVHDAWIRLHCEKGRNFFAYQTDVALLQAIQDRILAASPARDPTKNLEIVEPKWLSKLDGSLPSRILPYMYLGNLTHANNPEMLRLLNIKRILSIGEPVAWLNTQQEKIWGRENMMTVDRVQDNGIDPLTGELDRCLEFIGKARNSPFCRVQQINS